MNDFKLLSKRLHTYKHSHVRHTGVIPQPLTLRALDPPMRCLPLRNFLEQWKLNEKLLPSANCSFYSTSPHGSSQQQNNCDLSQNFMSNWFEPKLFMRISLAEMILLLSGVSPSRRNDRLIEKSFKSW